MEFRLMVPIIPLLCVLAVQSLRPLKSVKLQLALVLVPLIASPLHAKTFHSEHGIESVKKLNNHIRVQGWDKIGRTLHRLFYSENEPVVIGTTAAGAIPFYSRLRTIDMLGINDPWVVRNGIRMGDRPGHQWYAPLDYIKEKKVNLVIG
ncbi:MAG: hypothetical protein GY950_23755, partial [bacterium]|nr:hypothetical protein [bacterium]